VNESESIAVLLTGAAEAGDQEAAVLETQIISLPSLLAQTAYVENFVDLAKVSP
jgi:hypothetical protein